MQVRTKLFSPPAQAGALRPQERRRPVVNFALEDDDAMSFCQAALQSSPPNAASDNDSDESDPVEELARGRGEPLTTYLRLVGGHVEGMDVPSPSAATESSADTVPRRITRRPAPPTPPPPRRSHVAFGQEDDATGESTEEILTTTDAEVSLVETLEDTLSITVGSPDSNLDNFRVRTLSSSTSSSSSSAVSTASTASGPGARFSEALALAVQGVFSLLSLSNAPVAAKDDGTLALLAHVAALRLDPPQRLPQSPEPPLITSDVVAAETDAVENHQEEGFQHDAAVEPDVVQSDDLPQSISQHDEDEPTWADIVGPPVATAERPRRRDFASLVRVVPADMPSTPPSRLIFVGACIVPQSRPPVSPILSATAKRFHLATVAAPAPTAKASSTRCTSHWPAAHGGAAVRGMPHDLAIQPDDDADVVDVKRQFRGLAATSESLPAHVALLEKASGGEENITHNGF